MKFVYIAVLLLVWNMIVLAQETSQCIFTGTVSLHEESVLPLCEGETPLIQLLNVDGSIVKNAFYDASSGHYGVSAFSYDGFSDSDNVSFRIIYRCDTLIARTTGDSPMFVGYIQPAPPEPRNIDLATNRMPEFLPMTDDSVWEENFFGATLHADDADNDELEYFLLSAPDWLTLNEESGFLSGTPGAGSAGIYEVRALVTDGYFRGNDTVTFTLRVLHTNHAPSSFHLVSPAFIDTIEYIPNDSVLFSWERAIDSDAGDTVSYQLVIVSLALDTIRYNTTDTMAYIAMSEFDPYMAYAWSVFATDGMETVAAADTFFFLVTPLEHVDELDAVPSSYSLAQNYPNPFNPSTTIEFQILTSEAVTVKIYSMLGEEVATIVDRVLPAGVYRTNWSAGNLAGGVYYYRLTAGGFTETKRMLLLK